MTTFRTITQLCAAALIFVCLPGAAHEADQPLPEGPCTKPEYPRESLRRGETGISLVGFHVRADGTVGESTVFVSSGSSRLDQATVSALSACRFKPVQKDGAPVDAWIEISYIWSIDDDPDMRRPLRNALVAAATGDAAAYFRLYLLLTNSAETDAERERALLMLLTAAERGHAHAQFEAGLRYEKGRGLEASLEKSKQWYEKSAAHGNVLARQRLELGILPR
jgi:TonB family protein